MLCPSSLLLCGDCDSDAQFDAQCDLHLSALTTMNNTLCLPPLHQLHNWWSVACANHQCCARQLFCYKVGIVTVMHSDAQCDAHICPHWRPWSTLCTSHLFSCLCGEGAFLSWCCGRKMQIVTYCETHFVMDNVMHMLIDANCDILWNSLCDG